LAKKISGTPKLLIDWGKGRKSGSVAEAPSFGAAWGRETSMTIPFCCEFKVQGSKFKVDPECAIHAEDVGWALPTVFFGARCAPTFTWFFPEPRTQNPEPRTRFRRSGRVPKNLNRQEPHKKFKGAEETADKLFEVRRSPRKANCSKGQGSKITGLQPFGQGSGIAEVDRTFGELGGPNRKARSVAPE
jgi:hypothetical protein